MTATITPFVLKDQWVKIECDLKDEDGNLLYDFWIEARKNLSIGEQRTLTTRIHELNEELQDVIDAQLEELEAIDAELEEINARPPDIAEATPWKPSAKAIRSVNRKAKVIRDQAIERTEAIEREKRDLITPYIRSWNLATQDESGTVRLVPPPSEGGMDVLENASTDLMAWMLSRCAIAYRMGKALTPSTTSAGSQEPTPEQNSGGPKVIPSSNSRRSRKSS